MLYYYKSERKLFDVLIQLLSTFFIIIIIIIIIILERNITKMVPRRVRIFLAAQKLMILHQRKGAPLERALK